MRKIKQWNWSKILSMFVFASLLVSAIFVAVRLVLAPSQPDGSNFERLKSDYVLMLVQCVLGMVVLLLPSVIARRLKIEIPSGMMILFVIFLYCAIYLGEVRSFYYHIQSWDTVLHWFSGAMIGALGFSFVALFNNSERIPVNLSPFFVAAFAFCFAVTLGVFWEFYEYSFDGLLGLNMQKFALEDGTQLVGRAALQDTMKDLVGRCCRRVCSQFNWVYLLETQERLD